VAEGHRTRQKGTGDQQTTEDLSARLSPANSEDGQTARENFHARASDRNIQNTRLTWPSISAKLANDPALRYTEGGRAFIRWMTAHAAQAEAWREFIDAIPIHWLGDVGLIAGNVSAEWHQFAEWLRNKQRPAS
jgi:hypothetical protein